MKIRKLIKTWFEKWETGDFLNLPITETFKHTSPYGTLEGKQNYIDLVDANKDKFLGHRFEIIDEIYETDKACIRYRAIQEGFTLEVSEWYYLKNGLIGEIIAYYNIDEQRIVID